jgi:hypothetical protein
LSFWVYHGKVVVNPFQVSCREKKKQEKLLAQTLTICVAEYADITTKQ